MRQAHPKFEAAGAQQVTISAKSASMASTLQPDMPFPLLIDENQTARAAFGLEDLSVRQWLSGPSVANYARAAAEIRTATVHLSEARRTPTIIILDANQNEVWRRVGQALGDYPTVDDVLAQIPTS